MARKRKNRTHLKGVAPATTVDGVPKSFIIKHGPVGHSIAQLVRDFRKVMEPNTASRLRERNRNKLKDYLTLAPALQVTHLLAFTLTPSRLERYSLMKDILNTSRRARSIGMEYLSHLCLCSPPSPSVSHTPPHLTLLMKSFQSLFPPLSPHTLALSSARRVVLISYNAERGTVDFRHYVITVKPYGVSKRVRRVLEGTQKPRVGSRLGNEKDVADFLLRKRGEAGPDGGYESAASSTESVAGDDGDAVDLADDYVGRNNKKGQRRAVRLDEVGPRMELRLVKLRRAFQGRRAAPLLVCSRSVLTCVSVKKTKKEAASLQAAHAAKEKLRKSAGRAGAQRRKKKGQRKTKRRKGGWRSRMEPHDGEDDDEADWDAEEEISEGEDSEEEPESGEEEEERRRRRGRPQKK
ncbi:Brix domain-containing protein [Mycena leptocephala]|nr:Brix domain-containing protein [Mycena leptocephala]